MKRYLLSFIIAIIILACDTGKTPLATTDGEIVNLLNKPVALMWMVPDCPLCQSYSTFFVQAANRSLGDIQFYGVLPGALYTSEEVQHFKDSFRFDIPIILDSHFALTQRYNVEVTPEFLLLDSNSSVLYQGKYDDWALDLSQKKLKPTHHFFEDAVSAFEQKAPIKVSKTIPIGCIIEFD